MGAYERSKLGAFIMEESDSYDALLNAINKFAVRHKSDVPDLCDVCFDTEQTETAFKFAHNIVIIEDIIT